MYLSIEDWHKLAVLHGYPLPLTEQDYRDLADAIIKEQNKSALELAKARYGEFEEVNGYNFYYMTIQRLPPK